MLPIGALEWPDTETLFVRLLKTVGTVQFARLYGVPGQSQAGIDAYARLPLELRDQTAGRDYVSLQSRRVKSLRPAGIRKAVDDFLKGEWADRSSAFYFATSFDLRDTKFDAEIRAQTDRLAELGITFIVWDVQEVSAMLKSQHELVDDFFGRPWLDRFCGSDAVLALDNRAALKGYLDRLKKDTGRIDLSLLAEDLPPVVIDGLIDGIKVKFDDRNTSRPLLAYVRRWRRLIIVGQPGSGKSVAMREIAAHCASHPHAPIPLRVRLPDLIEAKPDGFTIENLIEQAAMDTVGESRRASLREHLTVELAAGRAIVLCDSLDECGARAAWVAQQLNDILASLHPAAGFIVATRTRTRVHADRLGLNILELAPPSDLGETVDRILKVSAETRLPKAGQKSWLTTHRAWIDDAQKQHRELMKVPLLAVMVALVCANASDVDLPRGRARLLHRAVEQSVHRWELNRRTMKREWKWSLRLEPAMLLDGFIVLGRMLDGAGSPSEKDALRSLSDMLKDPNRWATAPRHADEMAKQILRFWDEHMAVFVVNTTRDELTSSSKVFSEIATAMWASTRTREQLTAWLREALAHTDSDDAIALAAELESTVATALLHVGGTGQYDAIVMLADLTTTGIVKLDHDDLQELLGQLTAAVITSHESPSSPPTRGSKVHSGWWAVLWDRTRKPGPWPFVQAACQLALPNGLRSLRAGLIARAELDEHGQVIANALCELSDATTDERMLDEDGVTVVETAIELPLPPERNSLERLGRRSTLFIGSQLADGLPEVALAASDRLGQLRGDAAERLFQIAIRSPGAFADPIFAALQRTGFDTSPRWSEFHKRARNRLPPYKNFEADLLADLESLVDPIPHEGDDLWSLTEIGDLMDATRYGKVSSGAFTSAFSLDGKELRRKWLGAIADAHGIDKAKVAAQARHLIELNKPFSESPGWSSDWSVVATSPLVGRRRPIDLNAPLTTDQEQLLLSCLQAVSDWIALAAAEVLFEVDEPSWDSRRLFEIDMTDHQRSRAELLYLLAIRSAGEDRKTLLGQAADSDSADYRSAARLTIETTPDLDPDESIMARLCRDPDLSVRPEKGRGSEPLAIYWTCDMCRSENSLSDQDCQRCDFGHRPTP